MENKKGFTNSRWNRVFHKKQVNQNIQRANALRTIIELAPAYIEKIGEVTYQSGNYDSAHVIGAPTLRDVMKLHKNAWADGFQHENIGPCHSGMYRCESIETMRPEDVYIGGNLYGLNTHNIPFWDECMNEGKTCGGYPIYSYLTVYQIVLQRYKDQLSSNIRAIADEAKKELEELTTLGY